LFGESPTAQTKQEMYLVEKANTSCKVKPLFAPGGVVDNSFLKEHGVPHAPSELL
jgi:hypothetical protein